MYIKKKSYRKNRLKKKSKRRTKRRSIIKKNKKYINQIGKGKKYKLQFDGNSIYFWIDENEYGFYLGKGIYDTASNLCPQYYQNMFLPFYGFGKNFFFTKRQHKSSYVSLIDQLLNLYVKNDIDKINIFFDDLNKIIKIDNLQEKFEEFKKQIDELIPVKESIKNNKKYPSMDVLLGDLRIDKKLYLNLCKKNYLGLFLLYIDRFDSLEQLKLSIDITSEFNNIENTHNYFEWKRLLLKPGDTTNYPLYETIEQNKQQDKEVSFTFVNEFDHEGIFCLPMKYLEYYISKPKRMPNADTLKLKTFKEMDKDEAEENGIKITEKNSLRLKKLQINIDQSQIITRVNNYNNKNKNNPMYYIKTGQLNPNFKSNNDKDKELYEELKKNYKYSVPLSIYPEINMKIYNKYN